MSTDALKIDGEQAANEPRRELAEARERQAATAGVLQGISSSPTDLQHAFAVVAASAARLCTAYDATNFKVVDNVLRRVAIHGSISTRDTLPLTREVVIGDEQRLRSLLGHSIKFTFRMELPVRATAAARAA